MQKFVRNLLTEWRRMDLPVGGEKFIVAVSGGADSVSLACALGELSNTKKLRNEFIVAHFDHGLRGAESRADRAFTEKTAERLNFEFVGAKASTKIERGENLEAWARRRRYEFLERTAVEKNARWILTAHTKNDQAETFLLNLLRGSGLAGLAAMPSVRPISENSAIFLARPFLRWALRSDVEKFAEENEIEFRQDRMNEDESFERVRIRKNLLPELCKHNPQIVSALSRTAQICALEKEISDELLAEKYREIFGADTSFLPVRKLKLLPSALLGKALRRWLEAERGDLRRIESKHIDAIADLVLSRKSGRYAELPGKKRVVKENGKIFLRDIKVEK